MKFATLAAACVVVAGCSSVRVATDYDRDVGFSKLTTFAWMPRPAGETDPYDADSLVRRRVESAVERELSAKGLRRVGPSPDFVVAWRRSTRERVDVTTWPGGGYGWGRRRSMWGGDRVDVTQYVEGALVIDFVDPASKQIVWRGVARTVVDGASTSPERIDAAVHAVLAEYPPAK